LGSSGSYFLEASSRRTCSSGQRESTPIVPGTPITAPTPIFAKLDPSVVDGELLRLEARE
jgi:hypothetical protein